MPEKKWIGWVVIMISLNRYYLGELIRLLEWRHATRPRGVTRRGARDDERETSGGAGYFNLPRWRITYEKSVTLHRKIVNLHLLYIRTRVDVRCGTSVATVACGFLVSGGSLRLLVRQSKLRNVRIPSSKSQFPPCQESQSTSSPFCC